MMFSGKSTSGLRRTPWIFPLSWSPCWTLIQRNEPHPASVLIILGSKTFSILVTPCLRHCGVHSFCLVNSTKDVVGFLRGQPLMTWSCMMTSQKGCMPDTNLELGFFESSRS